MPQELIHFDLGTMDYDSALDIQRRLLADVQARPELAYLLTVEHAPPVITLGRNAKAGHVLAGPDRLASLGVQLRRTSRGGDVTYHGPGQLVIYPIMRVDRRGGLRTYVSALEEAVIRMLGELGIPAARSDGLTGVWAAGGKIAAIGIGVSRWVAYHGLALNVSTDLSHFDLIVPCGLSGKGVTSIRDQLGRDVSIDEIKPVVVRMLAQTLGFESCALAFWGRNEMVCHPQSVVCFGGVVAPPSQTTAWGWHKHGGGPKTQTHPLESVQPRAPHLRLPQWLRKPLPPPGRAPEVRRILDRTNLATVCAEARCPNRAECHSRGTATFMIMGRSCTRSCRFCAVAHDTPSPLDAAEPRAIAQAAASMRLRHVVITSVTRDDLPDGGAGHFAAAIRAVPALLPQATIEVLTPDFRGQADSVRQVVNARPDVFNHNIETVPRLYDLVRPQARYARSLDVLALAARLAPELAPGMLTKSGIMAGLGERPDEIVAAMRDLRQAGVAILTVGQYLAPSDDHLSVAEFIAPEQFDRWRSQALAMGFSSVASGPFVRSSYHADEVIQQARH